jgi:uncharacterized membrane protein (UPF0127 family)
MSSHFLTPMLAEPTKSWGLQCVTTGQVVATRLDAAFDAASRKKGLLGRDTMPEGNGLVIAPCGGIHTFFMRFPIDVLFLARDGRVMKLCEAVKPWRLALAPTAFCVIELPANSARRAGVLRGERVAVIEIASAACSQGTPF